MSTLVLLAEDSPEAVEAVRRTVDGRSPATQLEVVADGSEVIGRLVDTLGARPDLVLLDLPGPDGPDESNGSDGPGVLRALRARPWLTSVPVVALSSSADPHVAAGWYRAGASSFLVKPADPALFEAVLRAALDYWLGPVPAARV